jgi:hypothetical protein
VSRSGSRYVWEPILLLFYPLNHYLLALNRVSLLEFLLLRAIVILIFAQCI